MKAKIDWAKVGNKLERQLGSLKFAVFFILLFSTFMIVGTFLESYYGTDFANRTIYKKWPFMLIQLGMASSIIFAAFLRLPPKKRLYGFYTVHTGLITLGVASVITYIAGVDGQLYLNPNEPNRQVILTKDVLKFTYPEEGKRVLSPLPYSAFTTAINDQYDHIKVKKYIPFAAGLFTWSQPINSYPANAVIHSSKYFFKNPFAEEYLTLTLHPETSNDFQSTLAMGPLSFNYMPANLANCFKKNNPSGVIIWNSETSECFTPEERNIPVKSTSANNRFVVVKEKKSFLTFFPDFSPFPMDTNFKVNEKSIIRAFSKKLFEEKPSLFLFGKKLAFFSKEDKKWLVQDIEEKGESVALPWMGAEITLLEHHEKLVPFNLPVATIPIQKNGVLIKGDLRAVQLEILGKEYWVSNYSPLSLLIEGKKVVIEVTKETLELPFELALTQFKMDQDPGTNNPASYESFVKLFSDGVMTKHHIFMNNPMKHRGFTFYQASYSQDSAGTYSSTLTVNVDQGRTLKYLGSLMLVFGAAWHFNINKKKENKNKDKNKNEA